MTNKYGIEFEEIAEMEPESKESGIPVWRASMRSGSYITFAFLRGVDGLSVYHVISNQRGDFKRLMDATIAQFEGNTETQVTFFNVVSEFMGGRDLGDVLDGFSEEERVASEGPHEGDKYNVLVGQWTPQGRHQE